MQSCNLEKNPEALKEILTACSVLSLEELILSANDLSDFLKENAKIFAQFKSLKHLDMSGCHVGNQVALKNLLIACQELPLRTLIFSGNYLSTFSEEHAEIFTQFKSLEHLDIEHCHIVENFYPGQKTNALKHILNGCSALPLKELNISNNDLSTFSEEHAKIFEQFKSLKNLNIEGCFRKKNPDTLINILNACVALPLEQLNLAHNNLSVFSEEYSVILTKFKSLRDLNMTECFLGENPEAFKFLLFACTTLSLEKLNLSRNNLSTFSEKHAIIFTQFKSLRDLNMTECFFEENPEAFKFFLIACTKLSLEKLILFGNDLSAFSEAHAIILAQLKSLKHLNIRNCDLGVNPHTPFKNLLTACAELPLKELFFHNYNSPDLFRENDIIILLEEFLNKNYWCTELDLETITSKMQEALTRNRGLNIYGVLSESIATDELSLPTIKTEEIEHLKASIQTIGISLESSEIPQLLMAMHLYERFVKIQQQILLVIQTMQKLVESEGDQTTKINIFQKLKKVIQDLLQISSNKTQQYCECLNSIPQEHAQKIFEHCHLPSPNEQLQQEINLWIFFPENWKIEDKYFEYFEKLYHANLNSDESTISEFLYAFTQALLILVKSEKLNPVFESKDYQKIFDSWLCKAIDIKFNPMQNALSAEDRNYYLCYALLKKAKDIFPTDTKDKTEAPLGSTATLFAKNTSNLKEISQIKKLLTTLPDKADLKDRKKVIEIYEKVAELLSTMTVTDNINQTDLDNLKILMQAFQPKIGMENTLSMIKGNK